MTWAKARASLRTMTLSESPAAAATAAARLLISQTRRSRSVPSFSSVRGSFGGGTPSCAGGCASPAAAPLAAAGTSDAAGAASDDSLESAGELGLKPFAPKGKTGYL